MEALLEYGREAFEHRGGVVLYFDTAARRRLARAARDVKDLVKLARCYAVISGDGAVLTVGHRCRRINMG